MPQVLADVQAQDAEANVITFTAAMRACAQVMMWSSAILLLSNLQDRSLESNLITCSTILSSCDESAQWQLAVMLLRPCAADVVAYTSAISSSRSRWRVSHRLLQEMLMQRLEANHISFGATISSCQRAAQWLEALRLCTSCTQPDVVTFNVTCSSCEKATEWAHAVHLLHQLQGHLRPTTVSFNATIGEKGQWKEAFQLLQTAVTRALQPDSFTCTALVSALERASMWQEALEASVALGRSHVQLDLVTYNSPEAKQIFLISVCVAAAFLRLIYLLNVYT